MTDVEDDTEDEVVTDEGSATIDSIFEPESETEQVAEESTGETEAEESTGETESDEPEPPSGEETSEETAQDSDEMVGLKAALAAEREKRRAAEEKLAAQEPPEPAEVPDPVEDPEGYKKHLEDERAESEYKMRASISRTMMLQTHEDFAEKEGVFMEMTNEDPSLVQKLVAAENPALFAYEKAKEHLKIKQLLDPEYFNAQVEAKAKEIVEKMQEGESKTVIPDVPDLTQASAAGANNSEQKVALVSEPEELFPSDD